MDYLEALRPGWEYIDITDDPKWAMTLQAIHIDDETGEVKIEMSMARSYTPLSFLSHCRLKSRYEIENKPRSDEGLIRLVVNVMNGE